MPISEEIDGKVLNSVATESFQIGNVPKYVSEPPWETLSESQQVGFDKELEERLKAYGYVQ